MCHYYIPHRIINTFNYFAQRQSRVVTANSRPNRLRLNLSLPLSLYLNLNKLLGLPVPPTLPSSKRGVILR